MPGATAVVHTLGTLLEDTRYKSALKEGNVSGLVGAFISSIAEGSCGRNPLEEPKKGSNSYEVLNRDAALRVCETFLASEPEVEIEGPRPFVYVSAEDIFRPVIPARYIETKREAEVCIEEMIQDNPKFRGVYIRPSLIYHPHFRPLTSPIAAALDLSATIHSKLPSSIPTPSSFLRSLSPAFKSSEEYPLVSPSPFDSVANALTIPPIHVDHVAEAAIIAAENERIDVSGVYGVDEMRELIGWVKKGQAEVDPSHVERLRQHA
ncbi:hypothetical protein NLI96_g10478 [Meripilus lineatus]|uniref:Thioester reductase (TE) domain-containing protein n=1 Tax=Meripilus lineatus TaxID=2056292 RepID=A0AAD5UTU9_9APHY|nr:hypothetical protein NLI96_g10478 [Physisporinus lineatus]